MYFCFQMNRNDDQTTSRTRVHYSELFQGKAINKSSSQTSLLTHYEVVHQQIEGLHQPQTQFQKLTVIFRAFSTDFTLDITPCSFSKPRVNILRYDGSFKNADSLDFLYYCGNMRASSHFVHGRLEHGVFHGAVHYGNEVFYVDSMEVVGQKHEEGNCIIYKYEDINLASLNMTRKSDERINNMFYNLNESANKARAKSRKKRRANEGLSCHIRVFADVAFFVNAGSRNIYTTMGKLYYYITESNRIFVNTDFDSDGHADGIGVVLAEVTIIEDLPSMWGVGISPTEMDALDLLEEFSLLDHEKYCLAVLVTHRDFDAGTIGLAWLASSSYLDYPGGICQHRINTAGEIFSLNTMIVTSVNNGRTLLDPVIALTLTHELGHAFGSPHDPQDNGLCSPGGSNGYFIMHPYSTDVSRPNNVLFSQCSRDHISPVIQNKGSCFVEVTFGYCGDRIVQGEEECDCGTPENCHIFDPCCNSPTNFKNSCKLLNGSKCSPAVQSCCSLHCQAVTSAARKICHPASACMEPSVCDGVNFGCPDSVPRPDGSLCHQDTALCKNGLCSESRCAVLGLQRCDCSGPSSETHCQLCCNSPAMGCTTIHTLGILSNLGGPTYLMPGSSCLGETGYCNRYNLCVRASKLDTLKRIEELLLPSTAKRLKKWFTEHRTLSLVVLTMVVLLLACSVIIFRINRSVPVRSLARHTARMAVLWQQAHFELSHISDQIKKLDEEYKEARGTSENLESVEGFIRLCKLFPSASHKLIEKLMGDSTEEDVVKTLLEMGFAMNRFKTHCCSTQHNDNNQWIKGNNRNDLIHTI